MKLVTKRGVSRNGSKVNVFDKALGERIRKRLNLSKEDLPDILIRKIIRLSNTMIGDYIIDNIDGYRLEVGFDKQKPMGFLMVSKHLPKEFRDTKDEHIEKIQSIDISERYRQQLMQRYNVDVGRVIQFDKLHELKELIPHLSLHSYFYRYKVMWFNQRNCKSRKARSYIFSVNRKFNKKLFDNVWAGKEYHEANFHHFYAHKIKSKY